MVTKRASSDLFTPGTAARILHVHVNTVIRWSNKGILPVYRIGPRGDRRFQRQDVYGLIAELKETR
jgi:excisionase family DNA binding protein